MDKPVSEMVEKMCLAFIEAIPHDVWISNPLYGIGKVDLAEVTIDGTFDLGAAMVAAMKVMLEPIADSDEWIARIQSALGDTNAA